MEAEPQDAYGAWIKPRRLGAWSFAVVGILDVWGGFARDLTIRFEAGVDVALDLADGAALVAARAELPVVSKSDRRALSALASKLEADTSPETRVQLATREATMGLMRRTADLSHATISGPYSLWVEREIAGYSAWYEMFPRSEGAVPPRSGTFKLAERRLPAIAAMGFSVLYLPPIHPIGITHRKGPNNVTECSPGDPGSPWAIGAASGGHTAVHPDLGTIEDFDAFVGGGAERRPRGRAGLCAPVQPRSPLGHRASGVVPASLGWIDPLRGKPAQAVPGHLSDRLRERRRAAAMDGAARRHALLDRARRAHLPCGQSAHQGIPLLGMADRRDPPRVPGGRDARRSIRPAGGDAATRQDRLLAVVHVLHVAQQRLGAPPVFDRVVSD